MTLEDLIASIGSDRFEAACRYAWSDGSTREEEEELGDVAYDVDTLLWHRPRAEDSDVPERLELGLAIYRRMPCYSHVVNMTTHVERAPLGVRMDFWARYRGLLEQPDDRLAKPVVYSLSVDYFEGHRHEEAWREMTAWPPRSRARLRRDERDALEPLRRRLRRVLPVAGPVPWAAKEPLLEQLVENLDWHMPIFECLYDSAFSVCGNIDREAAARLFRRLRVPLTTEGRGKLAETLHGV